MRGKRCGTAALGCASGWIAEAQPRAAVPHTFRGRLSHVRGQLRFIIAIVSLFLAVGVGALWRRSEKIIEFVELRWGHVPRAEEYSCYLLNLQFYDGLLRAQLRRDYFEPEVFKGKADNWKRDFHEAFPIGWDGSVSSDAIANLSSTAEREISHEHAVSSAWEGHREDIWTFVFPQWPLLIPFLLLPAWRAIQFIRSRRLKKAGCCAVCGYDLRASPERCPECGTLTPAAST